MFSGIPHIISSLNSPWCAWTMLILLLCGILSEWFQPGVISQAHNSLVVRNDRIYKESPANFLGQLFVSLFRLGTFAMALYLCQAPGQNIAYPVFWIICGLVLTVFLVKMLCNSLIDYTFMLSQRFGAQYEHYGNLFTLVAMILYPMMLILLHVSSPIVTRWICGIVIVLFILVWAYRIIRTYVTSPGAVVYMLLYICTLEILPFAGLAYLSAKTISVL